MPRIKKDLVKKLLKKPEKVKRFAHYYIEGENIMWHIDCLYLPPNKKGQKVYKYLFIKVDVGTNKINYRILKNMTLETLIDSLKSMIKEDGKPNIINSDDQFNKEKFKNYLNNNKIIYHCCAPGNYKQICFAENANMLIMKKLGVIFLKKELETGEVYDKWINEIENVINSINENEKTIKGTRRLKFLDKKILKIGDKVRIELKEPENIYKHKFKGRFREGNRRWSIKTYKVNGYIIFPNNVIKYRLNNIKDRFFYFQELQEE